MSQNLSELKNLIISEIIKAQKNQIFVSSLYKNDEVLPEKNEFLFFIKPEITLSNDKIKIEETLDLIFRQFYRFSLKINSVKVLSAKYLKDYNIIAQHYGVINKISNGASGNLSDIARQKFVDHFNEDISSCELLGGNEFLQRFPVFCADTLDFLWQNSQNIKLAGGTYCEKISLDGKTFYLFNGFHPRQISHFTDNGRSIIVFTLNGTISWADARQKFIGATNPSYAESGSLRRLFLDQRGSLGLSEISQGMNGVHLSAGPVEGLVELIRYNSDFSSETGNKVYSDFSFGNLLMDAFEKHQINSILSNIDLHVDNKKISIFDLTEEKDSDEAVELLKNYLE